MVGGALWAAPVLALSATVPALAASTGAIQLTGVPGTGRVGTPVSGAAAVASENTGAVTATLSACLAWVDGTVSPTRVIGTGPGTWPIPAFRPTAAGSRSVTATLADSTSASAAISVAAAVTAGSVFVRTGVSGATNRVGTLDDVTDVAYGNESYIFARRSDGTVYFTTSTATSAAWRLVSGAPAGGFEHIAIGNTTRLGYQVCYAWNEGATIAYYSDGGASWFPMARLPVGITALAGGAGNYADANLTGAWAIGGDGYWYFWNRRTNKWTTVTAGNKDMTPIRVSGVHSEADDYWGVAWSDRNVYNTGEYVFTGSDGELHRYSFRSRPDFPAGSVTKGTYGSDTIYALASGAWYYSHWDAKTWTRINGISGTVSGIWIHKDIQQGQDRCYAAVDGQVYQWAYDKDIGKNASALPRLAARVMGVESSGTNPTVYALTEGGGWHATAYSTTSTGSWTTAALPAGGSVFKLYTPVMSGNATGSAIAIVSGL